MIIRLTLILLFVISCNTPEYKAGDKTQENKSVHKSVRKSAHKNAPDFKLSNLTGQTRTLNDYKGRHVMINFWATWCPPCVAELPAISNVAKNYKDKNLVVLAINTDPESKHEKVRQLFNKHNYEFEVILDPELEIAEKYNVEGFPETFFVNKEGKLVKFYDPAEKMNVPKVISDREWDSRVFDKSFMEFFEK